MKKKRKERLSQRRRNALDGTTKFFFCNLIVGQVKVTANLIFKLALS